MKRVIVLVALCFASTATAQPEDKTEKDSAKALLQSGLKLYAAKDYLGALAVFKDAYARFPSGKILLNIGTTLVKLDRHADAANAYQRYLDSPDADPAKKSETTTVLADLDKKVGLVEITVEPADAQVQVGSDDWRPAGETKRVRVTTGEVTVRARRDTFIPAEKKVTTTAGASATVALKLESEPVATTTTTTIPSSGGSTTSGNSGTSIGKTFTPAEKAGRFGAFALAHLDPSGPGASGIVGLGVDVTNRISLRGGAILGKPFGGYVGASFAILPGKVRPIVAVAMPVFRSDGWRAAIRGAGGVELAVHKHVSLIAELGVEHLLNPEDSIEHTTMFIPAVGVSGRL